MTDKPPNPPAFPTDGRIQHGTDYDGMTLRDWFAGQVVCGFLASRPETTRNPTPKTIATALAEISYEIADAMLIERNRK